MAISAEIEGTFRLGDVFSKSFGVFGRHLVTFLLLSLLASIPSLVLAFAAPTPRLLAAGLTPAFFARLLVGVICQAIATGAVTYGVIQDLRGGTASMGQGIATAVGRFLPMIGVAISVAFLSGLASLLLIVPGIIVACMYYVAPSACIAERIGVGRSLSRSLYLTEGHRAQIFGASVLIGIVEFIAGFVSAFLVILLGGPLDAARVPIMTQALGVVFRAFNAVVAGVFYYQLRVAKEGVDIDKIASVFD
jgi:hypothetical protein